MTALQRDTVRTRRALLDAAGRAVIANGPAVSLEVVAREAGVSKGGLLHHFRTRDELLLAVAEDWIERFDETVQRHLDPEDDAPGRWCRAHIRAAFDPSISGGSWLHAAVLTALLSTPGFLQRARTSAERWQREMESDGLHPDRVLLVARALDGDAMNDLFAGTQDDASRNQLRELLLALTEDPGPLVRP
jgi:AcrR family transcriptional regulator